MATSDEEDQAQNFFRLVSLLIDNGGAVLRKVLIKHVSSVPENKGSLDIHLSKKEPELKNLQSRHILNKNQMCLLFPPPADIDKFDVTLLNCLLRNTCKLSKKEIGELEKLRTFRNEVCGHAADTKSVDDSIFKRLWAKITTVIREIASWSGDPSFIQANEDAMARLVTTSNFVRPPLNILKDWFHTDQLTLSRLDSLEEKTQQTEFRVDNLEEKNRQMDSRMTSIENTMEVLLKWMKSKGKWIPDDSNMTEAITNAYKDKKDNIIELLIREKVTPSPKWLLLATRMQPRNLSIIERTIGLLKSSRQWDPTNENIIEVVSAAFKHEQSDLIKLLQEAKVALPVRDFQYTVKNCDESAVNISIKYWKSTNQWNFEETDLQAAVSEAFRTCKIDIIECFLNEGFQLKPIHLCEAVKYGDVNLVKIAVNHLKSSGKWNFSDSVFATAMCDAYESNKEDMIELLYEEKVMLTPKCLYWAAQNQISQEPSLMKTTIQRLKSTAGWDPNHEDIEDAISEAFASFKEDIVQILASEGTTIPPNLFYWSVEQGCAPLVQVTINHLKSVGKWHQGDIDRDQALFKAHVCNQKDIIALLQVEGAKTFPKCLYWAAKHGDFPFVLDTIEAIKKAGKWDRDDGEIVKGLEKVQRYYKKHVLKDTPTGSMKGKRYFEEEMFRDTVVEGVKLPPKCLYLAAKHADFPFVNDIIEAIKNAEKWDRDDAEIVKGLEEVQRYYKKHVLKDTPTGSMKDKRCFEQEMVRDIMVDVKERRPSF